MKMHRGRLVDHIHLRATDLAATKRFYRAVLQVLDIPISGDTDDHLWCDELWIDALNDEARARTHVHLAFQAVDRQTVDRFHSAALSAGGTDNGPPGERPYHPGYYGAFVLDPDGNNIEAVHHGPTRRSAATVELERE